MDDDDFDIFGDLPVAANALTLDEPTEELADDELPQLPKKRAKKSKRERTSTGAAAEAGVAAGAPSAPDGVAAGSASDGADGVEKADDAALTALQEEEATLPLWMRSAQARVIKPDSPPIGSIGLDPRLTSVLERMGVDRAFPVQATGEQPVAALG